MTLNPFIWLYQNPVAFFSALGYIALMIATLYAGLGFAMSQLFEVYKDWQQNKHREKWARLYGEGPGHIPTGYNAGRLFVSLLAITAASWSVGGVIWYVLYGV